MPPEPGWLGRLIDERASRRECARTRLKYRLRNLGESLEALEVHLSYRNKNRYIAKYSRDIKRRIKKRRDQLEAKRSRSMQQMLEDL
jgi:hypothetical protein